MDDLTKPLTEVEKAELSNACQYVLNPAGMNLLRRLMFELDQCSEGRCASCGWAEIFENVPLCAGCAEIVRTRGA